MDKILSDNAFGVKRWADGPGVENRMGKWVRPFLLALFFVLCYTDSIPDGDTVGTNTRFCYYNKEISFLLSTAAEHPVSDGPAVSRTAKSNSEKSMPGIGQIHSEQQNERMLLILTFS